jgi:hypothetical protein
MNYYNDYSNQRTRKDELMKNETPLIDYAPHRRTDEPAEYQDGAGALGWLAVAAVCWIVVLVLMAKAGYFS